jgi:hypothetical protein
VTGEIWKPIPGFVDSYEVSNLGMVRSLDRVVECLNRWGSISRKHLKGRILKPATNEGRHLFVSLGRGNQEFIHRLVLSAFVRPCGEGEECRHLDGNPANNRLENLAWGTRLENMADRKILGEENPPRGERSARATLTEAKVRHIRREMRSGRSYADIGREIGATRNAVRKVAVGSTWGWLA